MFEDTNSSQSSRLTLLKIREEMMHKKSLKTALPIIINGMNDSGRSFKSYRQFSHTIPAAKSMLWRGLIYQERNSLMGTIFSYINQKALIVRGYPKIDYALKSRLIDKECVAEFKLDGTNILFWTFPDGTLLGKTRMVERYDLEGYKGRNWKKLTEATGYLSAIQKMCADGYNICGELYGSENPGEFIKYPDTKINIKFFEVCDATTLSWIAYDQKIKLLESYGLEHVGLIWRGILNRKNIEMLKLKAEEHLGDNGLEGFVAKWWDEKEKDTFMAKIKCTLIEEHAWKISGKKPGVPRPIILKAVKKAWDEQAILKTMDEVEKFVYNELAEEIDPEIITASRDKIKDVIYSVFSPPSCQDNLFEFFNELEKLDVNIENKGEVLSLTAKHFVGIKPGEAYKIYLMYLARRNKDG